MIIISDQTLQDWSLIVSQVLQDFLIKNEQLLKEDIQELMGWNKETMKAKMARRETPKFRKVKNLVLFSYEDTAEWLLKDAPIAPSDAKLRSAADLLGLK